MRTVAISYSAIYATAALWAWGTELAMAESPREHLLPGILLNVLGLPSSLLMESLVVRFPVLLHSGLLQLSITTLLGVIQVAIVWLISMKLVPYKRATGKVESGD